MNRISDNKDLNDSFEFSVSDLRRQHVAVLMTPRDINVDLTVNRRFAILIDCGIQRVYWSLGILWRQIGMSKIFSK